MKLKNLLFVLTSVLFCGFISCNQIDNPVPTSEMEATKTSNVKKGEPVIFKFSNAPEGSNVIWNVTPQEGVDLKTNGNMASALFSLAGNYTINASYNNAAVKANVSVNDTTYIPPSNSLIPLKDETIYVDVSVYDSTLIPNMKGKEIGFHFKTSKKYSCLNNYLVVNQYIKNGPITFSGVYVPESRYCFAGESEAHGNLNAQPIPNAKSNPIEFILEGKSYKGSYWVEGKHINVYWPYTSGVVFTNAVIVGDECAGFDVNNPDVDIFISRMRNGSYNCYKKDEYGQNLWLEMPKFNGSHLPKLINYTNDSTFITKAPLNPLSSRLPYPNGRNYIILGEYVMWIIEGIRTGANQNFEFPSLDPYMIDNSKPDTEKYKGLTLREVQNVGFLYYKWWNESAIIPEWWLATPPLQGTNYQWF